MEIKAVWEPNVTNPYGYIYVTHDLAENKYYCGKHKSETFDTSYFGSGVLLKKSMSIHEPKDFVCVPIDWAKSAEELHEKEVYWIYKFNAVNNPQWYNLIEDSNDYIKPESGTGFRVFRALNKLIVNNYHKMPKLAFVLIDCLCLNLDFNTNCAYVIQKKMSEDLGVFPSHISSALKFLYKLDFCRKTTDSSGVKCIMVNPNYISGCNPNRLKLLKQKYAEVKQQNSTGVIRHPINLSFENKAKENGGDLKSPPNEKDNNKDNADSHNNNNNMKESIRRSIKFANGSKMTLFNYLLGEFKSNKILEKTVKEISEKTKCNEKLVRNFLKLLEETDFIIRGRGKIQLKVAFKKFHKIGDGVL